VTRPDVRWIDSAGGPLPEVAAALGCPADLIVSVTEHPWGDMLVLFTPGWPEDEEIYSAVLEREDGVLVERSRVRRPGTWARIEEQLEHHRRIADEEEAP